VTGADGASAGAGLILPASFAEPWLAVVAHEEGRVPLIVAGDRQNLFFLQMER
jgi:hypothetical protein